MEITQSSTVPQPKSITPPVVPGSSTDKHVLGDTHPGFYNGLHKHLTDHMPNAMPGQAMHSYLRGQGFSGDELKSHNMDELFAQPKVTKTEALGHVAYHSPEIGHEKFEHEPQSREYEPDDFEYKDHDGIDWRHLDTDEQTQHEGPKGDRVLHHGVAVNPYTEEKEHYHVVQRGDGPDATHHLFHTPEWGLDSDLDHSRGDEVRRSYTESSDTDPINRIKDRADQHWDNRHSQNTENERDSHDEYQSELAADHEPADNSRATRFDKYAVPGGQNYREHLLTLPNHESTYNHDHWDGDEQGYAEHGQDQVENPLLQLRMKDRTHRDGAKALHLEEVQSDWHQDGHKAGYEGSEPDEYAEASSNAHEKRRGAARELLDFQAKMRERYGWNHPYSPLHPFSDEDKEQYHTLERKADETNRESEKWGKTFDTPDAPFKDDHWKQLGMKAALHEAVHGGHDRLSWFHGDVQNGKKLQNPPEGMKLHYDRNLPQFMDRYLKPFGVRTEQKELTDGNGTTHQVHSVEITPEMRQHIMTHGQPLWGHSIVGGMKKSLLMDGSDGRRYIRLSKSVSGKGLEKATDYPNRPGQMRMRLPGLGPTYATRKELFDQHGIEPDEGEQVHGHDLYHVTTNRDAVLRSGLLSRNELNSPQHNNSGRRIEGLGGGVQDEAPDKVSVTHDYSHASRIADTLKIAAHAARGTYTPEQIYDKMSASRPSAYDEDAHGVLADHGAKWEHLDNGDYDKAFERINRRVKTPEQKYAFTQALDGAMTSEDGTELPVGLAAPHHAMAAIDPDQIHILHVHALRGVPSSHVPSEHEFRFDPKHIDIDASEFAKPRG